METGHFSWHSWVCASVGIGTICTATFLTLGALRIATKFFEFLLWPGFAIGAYVYGGMHGGEPVLLSLAVNVVFYALLILFGAWGTCLLRSRNQSSR